LYSDAVGRKTSLPDYTLLEIDGVGGLYIYDFSVNAKRVEDNSELKRLVKFLQKQETDNEAIAEGLRAKIETLKAELADQVELTKSMQNYANSLDTLLSSEITKYELQLQQERHKSSNMSEELTNMRYERDAYSMTVYNLRLSPFRKLYNRIRSKLG